MNARALGKLTVGVVLIGGILAGLWAMYGPRTVGPPGDRRSPLPRLADARASVRVRDGSGTRRAFISCHGNRRRASGFWGATPAEACDALASTRTALLAGPGCARLRPGQVAIAARGRFGARRFAHRAVRGGCPDPEGWLAVDALASPVLVPDSELEDRGQAGPGGTAGGPFDRAVGSRRWSRGGPGAVQLRRALDRPRRRPTCEGEARNGTRRPIWHFPYDVATLPRSRWCAGIRSRS